MLRDLLAFSVLSWAKSSADLGWELLTTSVDGPTSRTCFHAAGVPSWLHGMYLAGGPAQFEFDNIKFNGVMDGFGMMNRFEMHDQQICYTSVWLDTLFRNESIADKCAKGLIFEQTTPPASILCMTGGGDNNWVNVIKVGDEALLLSDTSIMLRMDMETLAQPGHKHWSNDKDEQPDWTTHTPMTGSAHPLRRPGTKTMVGIVTDVSFVPVIQHSYVDVLTYEADVADTQPRVKVGSSGPLSSPPYLHSFGVTANYAVLPVTLSLGVNTSCTDFDHISCMIQNTWQGIHVVDLQTGKPTVFTETDHFAHVHIINSFENATGVTLDLAVYHQSAFGKSGATDISMNRDKTSRNANQAKAAPRRLHLHMSGPLAGKVTYTDFEKIPNSHMDFTRINENYIGLPYCYFYATQWFHDGANYASMAIAKYDVCKNTIKYWTRPNFYPGEPMFIQGQSQAEDDGVVVFIGLDGANRTSRFIVLDAETMTTLDEVRLPHHLPFTAHGEFFPANKAEITFV